MRISWGHIPAVVMAASILACSEPERPERDAQPVGTGLVAGEGFVDVEGGRVWYEIVGSGDATPLVLLHGGPGAPSHYLRPLAALADERPVIFYDQLGCGRSDRPSDPALWTVDRYVRELRTLRDALGLERVHLYGHSWGTILAVEYLSTDPSGVESLVLASPALDIPQWLEDTSALEAELPQELREAIDRHEEAGTTDSEEYQNAAMAFYRRHLCRLDPWPEDLNAAFEGLGSEVYDAMWGPSEFHATGVLKDYDGTDHLPSLALPVLFTAGRHDEALPATVEGFQRLVPGSKLKIFENSSHMTMLEEPEAYVSAVREFLREVESSERR